MGRRTAVVVVAPSIGAELELDLPAYGPAYAEQTLPEIAQGGSQYLAVWQDTRTGTATIYGARIAFDGTILDPHGFSVSRGLAGATPHVASDGQDFLVVWEDARDQASKKHDIYAARVTAEGAAQASFVVAATAAEQVQPSITFGGTSYLIAWSDYRNDAMTGADIYAARVDASGALLDATGIEVARTAGVQLTPTVTYGAGSYFVAWEDLRNDATSSGDVYGSRVSMAGAVLDSSGIPLTTAPGEQSIPTAAFDGTNYLVAWQEPSGDVSAGRVSPAGLVLDASGFLVGGGAGNQQQPKVACGTGCLVVWTDLQYPTATGRDIHAARVAGSTVSDVAPLVVSEASGFQNTPSVASDGSNYFVVWNDSSKSTTYGNDVWGGRVSAAGSVDVGAKAVASEASQESRPAAAFDGQNYFVVWRDSRNAPLTGDDIYGARLSRAGVLLDAQAIAISTAAGTQQNPSVAFDGSNFLVVWQDARNNATSKDDIYAARVSPQGVVLDVSGFPVRWATDPQVEPSVACGPLNCLVTWQDAVSVSTKLHAYRVGFDASILDVDPILVGAGSLSKHRPRVAYGAGHYLVAWHQGQSLSTTDQKIVAARVKPDGSIDAAENFIDIESQANLTDVAVASDGSGFVVAWSRRTLGSGAGVGAARLGASGGPLLPNLDVASSLSYAGLAPSVVYDGRAFFIAWGQPIVDVLHPADLYGARLDFATASLLDATPLLLSTSERDEVEPSLASNAGGGLLVAYRSSADVSLRARARLVTDCGASECGSGGASGAGGNGGSGGSGTSGGEGNAGTLGGGGTNGLEAGGTAGGNDGGQSGNEAGASGNGDGGVDGLPGGGGPPAGGAEGLAGASVAGQAATAGVASAGSPGGQGAGNGGAMNEGSAGSNDSSGCGCKLAAHAPQSLSALFSASLLSLGLLHRRRARSGGRRRHLAPARL